MHRLLTLALILAAATACFADVHLNSPQPGVTVANPVHFNAWADGWAPIASMIIYVDGTEAYRIYNNGFDTSLNIGGQGWHQIIIKAWDVNGTIYQAGPYGVYQSAGGGATTTTSTSSSSSGSSTVTAGNTSWNVQSMGGWGSCTVCAGDGGNGPVAGYSMEQWQGSPSLSGQSTKFSIWGSTPYSDVLWWKQLIDGDYHPDTNWNAHHFIYDTYFMVDNSDAVQALEFDINQYVNGHSLIFGTQCNVRAGNHWDIWDNRNGRWVSTGVWCPAPSAWNWHHVTIEVERASDGGDWLHYVSITLDGDKHYLDAWYPPAYSDWKGVTVNYQMDGNWQMASYTTWLDKMTFSYW